MQQITRRQTLIGMAMALLACVLWSFNFVISRGISKVVPPVSISFYRWLCASIIIIPLAWKRFANDIDAIKRGWHNIVWATMTGIALYSPMIYLAGHYSPAINLALIGTTAVPIFTFIIAGVFLKERITLLRILGLALCLFGILILISKGSWHTVVNFHFGKGDKWMLLASFLFSIYNIVVRRRPSEIHPLSYLAATFILGTLLIFPLYLWEINHTAPVNWNIGLVLIMLYSGAGTSVAAFFCWNAAIARIGSARTSVFGNSIPVLASIEAVLILGENVTFIQVISILTVAAGLLLSNLRTKKERVAAKMA